MSACLAIVSIVSCFPVSIASRLFTDLSDVRALEAAGKIQHNIHTIGFDQINETIDALRAETISGRAVVTIDES
jgi:D-arabinose 1-dehydrogenase-like Zn-dependent alcohol dehydrogenase